MFCPLCQKEYRDGFFTCSDCHLALVATLSEAESKNAQLCKGKGQHRFNEILACLDDAAIPRYYKEELSAVPRVRFFSVGIQPVLKFEVRVLKEDLAKAEIAIQQVRSDEDDESGSNGFLSQLVQNTWGLSFFLAFASFLGLIFLAVHHPNWKVDNVIHGPVFRAGKYVGGLFSHDDGTGYLFGMWADLLFLLVFWFTAIWWIKELRAEKQDKTPQNRW